jgi:hypothetical protein
VALNKAWYRSHLMPPKAAATSATAIADDLVCSRLAGLLAEAAVDR